MVLFRYLNAWNSNGFKLLQRALPPPLTLSHFFSLEHTLTLPLLLQHYNLSQSAMKAPFIQHFHVVNGIAQPLDHVFPPQSTPPTIPKALCSLSHNFNLSTKAMLCIKQIKVMHWSNFILVSTSLCLLVSLYHANCAHLYPSACRTPTPPWYPFSLSRSQPQKVLPYFVSCFSVGQATIRIGTLGFSPRFDKY